MSLVERAIALAAGLLTAIILGPLVYGLIGVAVFLFPIPIDDENTLQVLAVMVLGGYVVAGGLFLTATAATYCTAVLSKNHEVGNGVLLVGLLTFGMLLYDLSSGTPLIFGLSKYVGYLLPAGVVGTALGILRNRRQTTIHIPWRNGKT